MSIKKIVYRCINILIGIAGITLIIAMFVNAAAQDKNHSDFPPYKFAELPTESGIYKMVYQGCEIFIAVGFPQGNGVLGGENPRQASIATGRNCH